jgi:capsule polysaccharide export protein KpsE/RkpR
MATKGMPKRRFVETEIEPELISAGADPRNPRRRTIATLTFLWERSGILFRWAAIGLVASAIMAFLIPARYSSTTRLMPPDQSSQGMASMLAALGKVTGDMSGVGGQLLGMKTTGDLFVGVLRSRTVADDLINKFDLRKVYGDKRYLDARKELDARTDISSDRKSGIITLTVSDRNPQHATEMAREYVDALNAIVITLNSSSAHKERVFLEARLGEVQQGLEEAEKDFSQFASKNTAIDVKEQGRAMIGAAAELEGELIAAQTELEGLRQIYTSNNVRVRSVQARIDEYRRQLQKMGGKAPDAAANPSPESGTPDEPAQDYPSIRELPILGVTWTDLYRRTRVQEAVFETLTKQYELAKVEEARETPSVKVLDVADVPEKKSFPPRLIMIVVGTIFAFAMGGVWVLAQARWREMDPEDPGKMLVQNIADTIRRKLKWKVRYHPLEKEGVLGPRISHED